MKHVLQRLSITLLLGLSILSAQAVSIKYVTQKGAGLKDGSSWTNAYDSTSLQTAINTLAASGGGQVWVAGGNYYPTEDETGNKNPTDPRMKTFSLKKGVAVYGRFNGTETSFPAAGIGTWLSGEIGATNTRTDNCYNVVYSSDADTTAILNGFSIAYGNATGGSIDRMNNGGGLYLDGGYIQNCDIRDNKASLNGGGAYITGYTVIANISNSSNNIFMNTAVNGAGVYMQNGGELRNMKSWSNTATQNGGGVLVNGAGLVKNCTIGNTPSYSVYNGITYLNSSPNSASNGGGLWLSGNNAMAIGCTVVGNSSGVICAEGARVENCMIDWNSGTNDVKLENSTMVKCTVRDGGSVYSKGKSNIVGCLIHNNRDEGVYVDGSGTSIINSTISSNGQGGNLATYIQIRIVSNAPGECNLINSVLGFSNPNPSSEIKSISMPANSSFVLNCVNSASYDGAQNTLKVNVHPVFLNGPHTTEAERTTLIGGDWSINSSSSLLINAGTADTTGLGLPSTDLARKPRISHGTIDIGAYEYRNVRYVTQNGGTSSKDGKSWSTAYDASKLQSAISEGFGEVRVATGTYVSTHAISLHPYVKMYGGFKGNETDTTRERSDIDGNGTIEAWEFANPAILSGQNLSDTIVYLSSDLKDTKFIGGFNGFTIQQGKVNSTTRNACYTVFLRSDMPYTMSQCIIKDNVNITGGGGTVGLTGNTRLSACLIAGNTSNNGGGIQFVDGGFVEQSIIINNKCEPITTSVNSKTETFYALGGGVYSKLGGEIRTSIISNNTAANGAGVYSSITGKVENCTITDNKTDAGNGGGVCLDNGGTVRNSLIQNNTATQGGGVSIVHSGDVVSCKILNNSALTSAGAIAVAESGTIKNSLIVNNTAPSVGGVALGSSYCVFANNTLANNSDKNIVTATYASQTNIVNTVSVGANNINASTKVINSAFTDSKRGTNSVLLSSISDAGFVSPTSFIGSASTANQLAEITAANWSLTDNSSLINAGNTSVDIAKQLISCSDIESNPRVAFDKIDIGAYELQSAVAATAVSATTVQQTKPEAIKLSWAKSKDAAGYVVFVKQASAGYALPTKGTSYSADTVFGKSLATVGDGWFAVYSGADSTVQVSNLVPGAWYRVQVSAYRCSAYKTYSTTEEGKNLISVFAKQPQTITFTAPASVVGKNEVTLAAYSTSGMPITYSLPTGTKATLTNNRLVVSSLPAKVMVTATQAGDATRFYAADSVTATIVFSKDTSIITFMSLTEKTFGDPDFTLTASSSNGLSIVYESSNDSVASVVNNIVRINRGGTVTITAIQPESPLYTAAKPVSQKLFISAKTQSIQFDTIYPVTTETAFVTPVAKAESGKEITFSVSPDTVAKIVNNKIQVIGAGTAIVTAYQTGDSSYKEVTATRVLLVKKGMQVISFNALSPKSFSDSSFVLEAGSTTTTPIIFTCSDTNVVRIVGSVATIKKAGKVSITAKQNSTQNYDSAVPVVRPLLITKAEQIITFDTLKTRVYSSGLIITPNVSVNSKRKIMLSSSDVPIAKILNDTSIVVLSAGDVTIFANVAGDSCYNAASEESQTLTISRMEQTLSFDAVTKALYGAADINIHAKSSSRLPISISSSNSKVVSISDSLLSIEGVGEATITVSQKGDNFYAPKEMKFSIVVAKAKDSITFAALENKLLGQKDFTLYAETKSGTAVKFYSSNSAVASVLEDVVTINGAGVCQIRAVVKDSRNFIGDTTVQTFTVSALDVLKMPSFATSRDTIIDLNTLRLNRDSIVYSFVSAKHDSVVIDGSKAIVKPKHSSDCWEGTDTLWFKAANQAIIGDSLTFAVKLAYTRHADQLGMVTTDSLTGTYNIIAWEPQHGASTAQWIVCRRSQSLSQWENIDTVLAADSTYSIDRKVNTRQQAYQYALKTVDSYGCESPLSAYHTTMHLKTGVSLQNLPQLWWSAYEGVDVDAYIVYRKNVETQQYDSIGSTFLTSFTDQYPNGSASYRVAIRFAHKIVTSRLKNDSGPFSQSMSNLSEAIILSTSGLSGSAMTLSPNPVADAATLQCSVWGTYQITVSDAAGRTVMSFEAADTDRALIDASAFPQGSYTVTVRSGDEVHTLNLLKAE